MEQYFEREFLAIERELSMLKTAAQQSSGVVETTTKTTSLTISLSIDSSGLTCSGYARYRVKPDKDAIIIATLDWYHQNVADEWKPFRTSRSISLNKFALPNGYIGIEITVAGTNSSTDQSDDLSKLEKGQSVNVSATMTIKCTDEFTLEKVS